MIKKRGFTLIEILIALLIIAIALAAVLRAMTQSIRVTDKVKTVMAAHWVAMNALSEIQLGMIRAPKDGDPVSGSAKMFEQSWQWIARSEGSDTNKYAMKVNISVKKFGKSVGSLSGYLQT